MTIPRRAFRAALVVVSACAIAVTTLAVSGPAGAATTSPTHRVGVPRDAVPRHIIELASGHSHGCGILSNRTLECWGWNFYGQLGHGTQTDATTPVGVRGVTGAKQVALGFAHTCVTLLSGLVRCWGWNKYGQLGNGRTDDTRLPVTVRGLGAVRQVALGFAHSCALLDTGRVKCWGWNQYGQLGNGTAVSTPVPTYVRGLTDVRQIEAGYADTCALLDSGTAACWGWNAYGQLGDGRAAATAVPVRVLGLRDIRQLSLGFAHSCALLAVGAVRCWGWNHYGQLGDGSVATSHVPVTVRGLSGVIQVASSYGHTCALLRSGAVRCWGWNAYGQLGTGTTVSSRLPVLSHVGEVVQLSVGDDNTCALLRALVYSCWGLNTDGELGNGTFERDATPPYRPAAPGAVAAQIADSSLLVTWSAPTVSGVSPITRYTVTSRAGSHTCVSSTLSCTVTGLANGTSYSFTVTASNLAGPSPSSSPSAPVRPSTVPEDPTTVIAARGNESAQVTWQAPGFDGGNPVTGYTVTATDQTTPANGGQTCAWTSGPLTCTVVGLTNGDDYTFSVTATNVSGTGAASQSSGAVVPATVPDAPTGVSATRANASALVSWSAPGSTGGTAISGYTVTASDQTTLANGGEQCSWVTGPLACTVSGLTNGDAYTYTVTATNATGPGPSSAPSNEVTPSTVPDAPTGVAASRLNGAAQVTWSAPLSNGGATISAYTATATDTTTPANGGEQCSWVTGPLNCTVSGLTNGDAYTYAVTATNVAGTGDASTSSASVTPSTVPDPPRGVAASRLNGAAQVTWSAPLSNGGATISAYTATATDTTTPANGGQTCSWTTGPLNCTVSGLTNGDAYTYAVTATNVAGTGDASAASASVTPSTVPDAPTGVAASRLNGAAQVTWSAPLSNGGATISAYTATATDTTTPANGGQTCSWTTGPLNCTVSGLTNGDAYTYAVTATNVAGTGDASAASASVTPSTVPDAPRAVTGTANDTSVVVTWSAPLSNGGATISGYTVTAADQTTPANGGQTCSWATGPLTCTVVGLTNGDSYVFSATATNVAGSGAASLSSSVVVPATTPSAPQDPEATWGNAVAIIRWSPPLGDGGSAVSGYTVTATDTTTPANGGETCAWSSGPLACLMTGLTNGDDYTFAVTATNAIGTGAASVSTSPVTPGTSISLTDPSYGFNGPSAMVFDGTNVWVTNATGDTVTEFSTTDGSLVEVLSDPSYDFDGPSAIVFDGTNLWVTNATGDTVTEIDAANGSLVEVLSDPSYDFDGPSAIVFDGTNLWATNATGDTVTEIDAANGSLVEVLSDPSYDFDGPSAIAFDGTNLWVTNATGDTVTEIDAANGSLVEVLSDPSYDFDGPSAIVFDGTNLWVTNGSGDSITEIDAANGSLVEVLSGGSYGFDDPSSVLFDGTFLWVTNANGNSITEIDVTDGSFLQLLSGGSYDFDGPSGFAFDGAHLWVANSTGNSVTGIADLL